MIGMPVALKPSGPEASAAASDAASETLPPPPSEVVSAFPDEHPAIPNTIHADNSKAITLFFIVTNPPCYIFFETFHSRHRE